MAPWSPPLEYGQDLWIWWNITPMIWPEESLQIWLWSLISWLWDNQKGAYPRWAWPNQVIRSLKRDKKYNQTFQLAWNFINCLWTRTDLGVESSPQMTISKKMTCSHAATRKWSLTTSELGREPQASDEIIAAILIFRLVRVWRENQTKPYPEFWPTGTER